VEQRLQWLPVLEVADAVHEAWVAQRQEQGWQLGSVVDESLKTHPLLVSFKELPPADRDQVIALTKEILAAIFALGFLIVSPVHTPSMSAPTLEMSGEALASDSSAVIADSLSSLALNPSATLCATGSLDASLIRLTEFLAENSHDCWAARKMAAGWRYGERLDPLNRRHPRLVAYCDLPACEQDSDRASAGQVIVTLLELGYSFVKNPAPDEVERD